ncbi:DUF5133 domain-containing protein [Streptomyces violascens]|jgi:hypothetical protein|uniref:DUF5133 domain-containing protein n=1 Tax=Streptomyces violascens TaxID=67381 RepID=A0ABQ3QU43_9ACTN|nr:DUF5133 domain-containing protein [Streptomyces violascens]GGU06825.1 DUF5133 domain-containing protein [Streptomyces violascens]GHI40785.1 DUF5133 domain-containing protein [Streptomyces violascens]
MLMAHPAVLRELLDEYTALRALEASEGSEATRQRLDDVAYTLCVSTGTRDIDAAVIAARHRLPGARTLDDSVLDTVAT